MSKKLIIPAVIFIGGLLISAGVLISANLANAQSFTASQASQWTQNAGAGVSVPACSASGISTTCSNNAPVITVTGDCDHLTTQEAIVWPSGEVMNTSQGYVFVIVGGGCGSVGEWSAAVPRVIVGSGSSDPISPLSNKTYAWDVAAPSGHNAPFSSGTFTTPNCAPPPLPTADIKANGSDGPIIIPYNTDATISWSSTNASSCLVSPDGWTGTSGSSPSGNLTSSKTYSLSCTGPGGDASDNVAVNVSPPPSPGDFTLSVSKDGTGTGTVTSAPLGINCGATCSANYADGTSVTLTPTPDAGSTFTSWSGACTGSGSCVVSMTAAKSVTATFTLSVVNYTITTSINSGSGTITGPGISCLGDCDETYPSGTLITLFATPSAGYSFTSWDSSGTACAGLTTTSCSINMDGDKTAKANFSLVPPPFNYSLSNNPNPTNVTKASGDAYITNIITKTLTSGTTQLVTLSVSGHPSPVTYAIAPNPSSPTPSPGHNSTITFTVPPSTPVGTYPITVTGTSAGTPNKTTIFNLVVSGSPFSVSCSASPSPALLGQTVTWTAAVTGGVPPFTYSWSGTNIPTSPAPNANPFSIVYSTIGQKTATVTVTDTDSVSANCPAGTVRINFDPDCEEF